MSDARRGRPRGSVRQTPATVPVEVIADAKSGDQRSFDALFRTYQPGLLRYLHSVAPGLATDVAASTWESVATSLDRFSGDGVGFRRWLFTIARRRLVDEVRRDTRRPLRVADVPDLPDDAPGPDAAFDQPAWAAHVLAHIPTRQADVVSLRVLGGLSVDEVASLLGVSAGNVRVLSHRGLLAIQEIIERENEADVGREIFGIP